MPTDAEIYNDEGLRLARNMKAHEYTFGVEIETYIPRAATDNGGVAIGGYHRAIELFERYNPPYRNDDQLFTWPTSQDGKRFSCSRDSSLNQPPSNKVGCEFVSPILKGEAGMTCLKETVKRIKQIGGSVNHTCGVHIHVGIPNWLSQKETAAVIERLANFVGRHEAAIMASTGSLRRFQRGHYALPIKRVVRNTRWGKDGLIRNRISDVRMSGLNLRPLVHGERRAVEFRYFSGSLNPTKIEAWVKLCVAMVQYAVKSKKRTNPIVEPAAGTKYDAPTQAGRELNRLFHTLGWVGGMCKFENLGRVSNDRDADSNTPHKRILRKMAQKFADTDGEVIGYEHLSNDPVPAYIITVPEPQEGEAA